MSFFVDSIQHAETITGAASDFPSRFKQGGLSQRFTITGGPCWLELQLLFDFVANDRVVFRLNRKEVCLGRFVVDDAIRLPRRHPPIVLRSHRSCQTRWRLRRDAASHRGEPSIHDFSIARGGRRPLGADENNFGSSLALASPGGRCISLSKLFRPLLTTPPAPGRRPRRRCS